MSQYGAFGQTPTTITSSGLGTVVTTNGNIHDITGGTRPGNGTNLFHSFGEFSVDRLDTARFLNTTPELLTSNILGRVTGGDPSSILGTIDTLSYGNANLFLMNPAGFLFGPNATVNVGGMVAFTSADYLRLGELGGSNAGIFHSDPTQASLLTSVPVAAFGFLGSIPGAITVQGSQFTVTEGRSISLVGGNVTIQSGALPDESIQPAYLAAPGGKIHIASVATAGEILVDTLQTAPNIEGQSFSQFGATSISESSTLDVSGESSGTVRIRSGQFIADNGFLFAGGFGEVDGAGNAVSIDASNDVLIGNQSMIDATSFGTGRTGDIEIYANNLSLEGSIIEAQGFGGASAGNISLTVGNTLSISGIDSNGNGSLITTSGPGPGTGTGGAVTINASDMVIADQGTIRTDLGAEFAGGITLEVQNLTLSTGGLIQAFGGDLGPSGKIKIMAADSISLNGNGDLSTRILSQNVNAGEAGTIIIETGTLTLSNSAQISSFTDTSSGVTAVPKLSITADSVTVSGGSRIDITSLHGDVGALEISAQSVTLTDRGLIRSSTSADGNSGSINITADNMTLSDGSQINSSTEGTNVTGQGGDISLTVTENLALAGGFIDESGMVTPTAIQSSTQFRSLGDAGRISITAGTVDISNGALIASRSASGATGDAGNIDITATNGLTMQNSAITTEAGQGASGGDIKVTTSPAATVWLQDSLISASVADGPGGGGNISIDPQFVILQNSQILAQAAQGQGGAITIIANLFLPDANSLVNADSGSGTNGTITIQSPNAPVSGQIQPLNKTPLLATSLLNQRCAALADGQFSSFTVAGRDSLPTEPGSWLTSPLVAFGDGEGLGVRSEGQGVRGKGLEGNAGQAASGEWQGWLDVVRTGLVTHQIDQIDKTDQTDQPLLSLRQIAPAGFLTQAFAVNEPAGCQS